MGSTTPARKQDSTAEENGQVVTVHPCEVCGDHPGLPVACQCGGTCYMCEDCQYDGYVPECEACGEDRMDQEMAALQAGEM